GGGQPTSRNVPSLLSALHSVTAPSSLGFTVSTVGLSTRVGVDQRQRTVSHSPGPRIYDVLPPHPLAPPEYKPTLSPAGTSPVPRLQIGAFRVAPPTPQLKSCEAPAVRSPTTFPFWVPGTFWR